MLTCPKCGGDKLTLCEQTVVSFRVVTDESDSTELVVKHREDDVDSQQLYCDTCEYDWALDWAAVSVEYR